MKKKLFAIVILSGLVMGCTSLGMFQTENLPPNVVPVIIQAFAAKEIRPGDTWKIYLSASYPEGKMRYIVSWVDQAGRQPYPPSMNRIKKENQKEFSGYIYLNTAGAGNMMDNVTLFLNLQIQADVDHMSQKVIFPVNFSYRAIQEKPPEGIFKEQDLGTVMIQLVPGTSKEGGK
jgi:hypothetical protein